MNNHLPSQFFLFNSNVGLIKIIEFDSIDNLILVWNISKQYAACKFCSKYKFFSKCDKTDTCSIIKNSISTAQSPDYIITGDFDLIDSSFNSLGEFLDITMKRIFPNFKVISLGFFKNIYDCRKYLKDVSVTLSGDKI